MYKIIQCVSHTVTYNTDTPIQKAPYSTTYITRVAVSGWNRTLFHYIIILIALPQSKAL